ncbi:hypothetical protein FOZ63_003314 [Perkinsus olseni]|uniref:Uncharacterized protein n=1 Tax=Perkinsus olseni TaxID=32597 RepID=A0A7J6QQF9_PEROL|nr:hypothetical protein FOZ63_003314 [Perkinsus olseni]
MMATNHVPTYEYYFSDSVSLSSMVSFDGRRGGWYFGKDALREPGMAYLMLMHATDKNLGSIVSYSTDNALKSQVRSRVGSHLPAHRSRVSGGVS